MGYTIIQANELNIRTWEQLLSIRRRLEEVIAEPDDTVAKIIETVNRHFSGSNGEKANKRYPRGFWKTNKVLKSYLVAKKAYEYIGKPHQDVILDDFRPYCSVGFQRIFGNTYKMLCLITGKRLQLSTLKNYTTKIAETEAKLKKYSNLNLTELDMTMLGFRDLLSQYLYDSYKDLFDSMDIESKYALSDSPIDTHVFRILITPGVTYDMLYSYLMAFKSVMSNYNINDRAVLCKISKQCGFIERFRIRRYIKRIASLMVTLNIEEQTDSSDRYFDILVPEENIHNTAIAKMAYVKP